MTAPNPTPFDLTDLARRASAGDNSAEIQLMEHLSVSFRLFAQHRVWNDEDAEEVVQDALMVVLAKYRDVTFESSFSGWAYQILNNKIMDYVKRKQTRRRLDEQQAAGRSESNPSSDPELRKRLIDCFRKLHGHNVRYARILNFSYQGYSTEEICQRLRIKDSNLYVLLMRARKALMACLGKGNTHHE